MKQKPIIFNITIYAGRDYTLEFLTDEVDFTGWTVEATIREFAEHPCGEDFICIADGAGIHLRMSPGQTKYLGWLNGEYDVFVIDPDNSLRTKLARGRVCVKPEGAR